jgi:hypothetical protein
MPIRIWREGLNKCESLKNTNWRIILKLSYRIRIEGCGLDSSSLELRPIEGTFEQGNEPYSAIKFKDNVDC